MLAAALRGRGQAEAEGTTAEALDDLRAVHSAFTEGHETPDLVRARELLAAPP